MTTTMPTGVDRAPDGADRARELLASVEIRRLIERFVRARVPEADAEDVVQTVLCDALTAPARPDSESELRRWLVGIARHKVADLHRRRGRERIGPPPEQGESAPPVEERSMVGWAERQTPETGEGQRTLDWLAREGEGEKLATIAQEENLPAAQVRQRVSRLRRLLRQRWVAELAAVAAVVLAVVAVWRLLGDKDGEPGRDAIVPEPPSALVPREPSPQERAAKLRAEAAELCRDEQWQRCVQRLDEAARLDPTGDELDEARELRQRAATATAPQQTEPSSKLPPNDEAPTVVPRTPTPTQAPAPTPTFWQPPTTPTGETTLQDSEPIRPQKPGPTEELFPKQEQPPAPNPSPTTKTKSTPPPAPTSTAPPTQQEGAFPSSSVKGGNGKGSW